MSGEFAFVAELDLEHLPIELEERGAVAPRVEVTVDADGKPRSLRVSFGVDGWRVATDAGGAGHALLRDAVRRSFTHQVIDARRLANRGR